MSEPGQDVEIEPGLVIPAWELQESFVRASGPGGQNVNKVSTAVQLRWNVDHSSLPATVKERIKRKWRTRLTRDGDLVIDAQSHRSQALNREAARARLAQMVRDANIVRKRRVATKPTKGSVRRRLAEKSKRSEVKAQRGRVRSDEE
ncbi:MAG: alternative ribosome rescue aminoacyl-tRNA hydrolase ArfB [Pseudomonadota bacterium]